MAIAWRLRSSVPLLNQIGCRTFTSQVSVNLAARLSKAGLLRSQGLIGAKWSDAYDGSTLQVHNPATGEVIGHVPCMGRKETEDAISSAHLAFPSWSKLTAADRSNRLRKWFDLLIAHKQQLGQLITLEQGKPLKEAMAEVSYGASFIEFFAEEAKRVYGDIIPPTLSDRRLLVLKQPVGIVGAITPWNFPLAMITRKVGPALACGCTVVVKPSEITPLTALAAAELALQAGIPPGVLNVVMGKAREIGDTLLTSPQVRKITFTGSTAVGKKLMEGAAGTVKKVSLELGGNAPCIVFDDADIDTAVKGSLAAKFRNSGQTCVCANRILVQEGIYEEFAEAFSKAVQNLQVGDGFTEGVAQGPLINEAAVQKVESFVQDAVSKLLNYEALTLFEGVVCWGTQEHARTCLKILCLKGAKILLGGKRHSLGRTFYEPTVISDVKSDMVLSREEVFGPVAPILRFKTEEEAISLANDTNAGLAAYIFTNNIQRSWRVTEALEYGLIGVNEGIVSTEVAPFGGVKQSGLGREGSKYGMDDYLELKYVCLGDMNRK
ncbi:succinate-semialdehyde dehydrogenase, mitochondrial isoform X1 [Mercurialis annua]|uniref:succinate-semialdehyde dehydrogenase, mitochondrial isoform X1 n=1 Tax=Mercurialis annua TaxID=3986 RepID=UPI00215E36E0|nr:succinate-semialdehyde dehydrogenase, mitochondrial isoform X1 [Mercurialis annua]XP_050227142.1 succinate-semialdehyde dehydrogenase, mitochondrial isoform X1 [Mercurialis annua]XP_050227143.1 succinate-semialdehyde dehydrogenase, mitochondrial isoform X1 [Mercurialis annua]XP_050227144.1 succinate-semialdehyde dehydrogenase, mitochondrial isoform X1 [Mercurialis annua]